MSHAEGSGATRAAELASEDAFLVDDELGLYVVCDSGSSGTAGALAADVAVHSIERTVADAEQRLGSAPHAAPLSEDFADFAIRRAIEAIFEAVRDDPEAERIAADISLLLVLAGRGVVGHTGRSRVYRIRGRRLERLAIDHSESAAIASEPLGGARPGDPTVDTFGVSLRPDDVFVLCTDGAVRAVEDPVTARSALDCSPTLLASRIASLASRLDPDVDATAVVVRVHEPRGTAALSLSGRPRLASFGHVVSGSTATDTVEEEEQTGEEGAPSHGARRRVGPLPRPEPELDPDDPAPVPRRRTR
jgi:serine/threonine protein phosphatase PrpC